MSTIQLFAYDIATHDGTKVNAALSAQGAKPAELPAPDLFRHQAQLQLDLIKTEVTKRATARSLPVFMAPEFFFKAYDGLPYDRATFFNGVDVLKTFSASVPDVLWVIGTIWWQEPVKSGQALVHNTALVLKAGTIVRSWQKERLSGIDGLAKDGTEVWDRWEQEHARVLVATQDPLFQAPGPGGEQISMGIEICLDHLTLDRGPNREGVLRTTYVKQNGFRGAGVDVHLLTAAGMRLQKENIVSRRGGAILRVDGGRGAKPRSQSAVVAREGSTPESALRRWAPTLAGGDPVYVGNDPDDRLAVHPPVNLG
ncbi:hypothetical protein BA895_18100 [Humibacillus sp. DSM 29435]|uniref:hypothetical protein n=1 Tax=Humibacillus sp. DSM 29435 TaxID=1869167 RepID=UPI000872F24A|nr:hypothetical protein [Humibacillus sp. DSM 29435]OFE17083.1 hypothetical protein BA895_18100 [Humibacillus sp. DSM 29435]